MHTYDLPSQCVHTYDLSCSLMSEIMLVLFCVCVRTARFCFNWRAIRNLTDQAYNWAYEVAMYDKDMSDFQFESRPEMCKSDRNVAYTSKDWPLGIPVTAQVCAFALFLHSSSACVPALCAYTRRHRAIRGCPMVLSRM
jgi:hypothetical protein